MMTDQEIAGYVRRTEELFMSFEESEFDTIPQFVEANKDYLTEFITSRQQGR